MFGHLPYPLTLAILLGSMVAAVVVTAALEVRTPRRRRYLDARTAARPVEMMPVEMMPVEMEPAETVRAEPVSHVETGQAGSSTTGSSTTVLALGPTGWVQDSWVELGPLGIEKDIAGVLFAAYVASEGTEWSRVTGWVTACADPPSLDGVTAGERLRGKPAKVRALLECTDDSRNWVTVDDRTDIALAIERKAPRDKVLVGLLHWWGLSASSTPSLARHEVLELRFGIAAVQAQLRGHPLAPAVEAVVEACRLAEQAGVGLEQHLVAAGAIRLVGGAIGSEGVAGADDSDDVAAVEDRIAG